jgi:predicted metal-binding membrane protein
VSSVRANRLAGASVTLGRHRLTLAVAAVTLGAWGVLAFGAAGGRPLMAICAGAGLWLRPDLASLRLALALTPPWTLAAGWALMVAAMMAPLTISPLRHVTERSFAVRRWRSGLLFVLGYGLAWMIAGVLLQALALGARLIAPHSWLPLAVAAAVAVVWQVSPAKQRSLNRCHRRPPLAAFGLAADRDAARFGLVNGAWCVGACWALMLLPLLLDGGHLIAMAAVALFLFAERLEPPAPLGWRWRFPGRALRIAVAQTRTALASGGR